jgi:hypothetical protein
VRCGHKQGRSPLTRGPRQCRPPNRKGLESSKQPPDTGKRTIIALLMLQVKAGRISSSCFGLVPEVGISRHECTQKQILCRVQSCVHASAGLGRLMGTPAVPGGWVGWGCKRWICASAAPPLPKTRISKEPKKALLQPASLGHMASETVAASAATVSDLFIFL